MIKRFYSVYMEDYCFEQLYRKLGEFEKFSYAKDYIFRIKKKFLDQPIELYIKCFGRKIFSWDCLDDEENEL